MILFAAVPNSIRSDSRPDAQSFSFISIMNIYIKSNNTSPTEETGWAMRRILSIWAEAIRQLDDAGKSEQTTDFRLTTVVVNIWRHEN